MTHTPDALARAGYSSPSILARRRRILEETRKLVAERGLAGLGMDEVCKRAGVAKRTLYNAFQSRERMIAAAIQQSFDDYASRLPERSNEAEIDDIIERLVILARRNIEVSNYAHALMTIYHAADPDPDIWREIHAIGMRGHQSWIEALARRGELKPWVDPEELTHSLVRVRFAVSNAWAQDRIPDALYLYNILTAFLTHAAGATRGEALNDIEARLRDLNSGGLVVAGESIATPPTRTPAT